MQQLSTRSEILQIIDCPAYLEVSIGWIHYIVTVPKLSCRECFFKPPKNVFIILILNTDIHN